MAALRIRTAAEHIPCAFLLITHPEQDYAEAAPCDPLKEY